MIAIEELQKYKKLVDAELSRYFDRKLEDMTDFGPTARDAVKSIRDLVMAGGKRLRAAFMYYGYLSARSTRLDGQEIEAIIEASMSIELTHIFLLIHDDIIDRDDFRHGMDSIHKKYEKLARKYFKNVEPVHFGNSMAIVAGDMAGAFGNEIIFNSKFPPERKQKALSKLQEIVTNTVSGEIMDVMLEAKGKASEKEILEVHRNKTAKYTVEGPLHLGALLAGAEESFLNSLADYAVPVGMAFQLQDDVLGIFGNEKKLGKPVCSDLRDGKQTLLVVKALEKSGSREKEAIRKMLGNPNISAEDINIFRKIVRDTGSLDYSQKLANRFIEEGKKSLERIDIPLEAKNFLIGIADYIVKREV